MGLFGRGCDARDSVRCYASPDRGIRATELWEGDAPAEPFCVGARKGGSAGASLSYKLCFIALIAISTNLIMMPRMVAAEDREFGSALIVGVGGAYAGTADEAAVIWFNPALMAMAGERGGFELSYRRQYDLDELGEINASVRHRLRHGLTLGAGFARFGQSGLYLETRGVAGIAETLHEKYALGVGLRYQRTEFGDNEMAFAGTSLDAGVAASPLPDIQAGIAVRGITLDELYVNEDQNPGVTTEASVAWSAPPDIVIAGIWSKEEGEVSRFGLGQRLRIASGVEFVSGLRFDPIRYTLGGHLTHRGGTIDYTYQGHPDLGGTHTIGIGWLW